MAYKVYYGMLTSGGLGYLDHYNWVTRTLIYDTDNLDDEHYLVEPILTREANEAGSFEADVPKTNICWGSLRLILGTIEIERDGEIIWQGRITQIDTNFELVKHIYCEGELAYLNDDTREIDWTLIRSERQDEDGNPTGLYMYNVVGAFHNFCGCDIDSNGKYITAKADNLDGLTEDEQLAETLGALAINAMTINPDIQVDDSRYVTTWDFLKNSILGGMLSKIDGYVYLILDREHDSHGYKRVLKLMVLNWDPTLSESSGGFYDDDVLFGLASKRVTSQTIEFGKNLLDLNITQSMNEDVKTYARVFGYETKGWWIFSSTEPIVGTAMNSELISRYGQIETISSVEGSSSTLESLDDAAQALLTDVGNCEYEEIEVNAVDLVDSGMNTDRLDFMKFSRVISEPHGVNLLLLCTKMVEPLDDPSGKKFTFGSKKKRLSSYQSKYNATTERSYNIGRNVKSYVTDS